ncbi:MAG: FtsW/RodA/SpoVE family cell cycle protein [Flavobacteriales bacterium]
MRLLKGDKSIWVITIILLVYSFIGVYSSSSTIAFQSFGGNNLTVILRHLLQVILGLGILIIVSHFRVKLFKNTAILFYLLAVALIIVAQFQGKTMNAANANRWIPIFGLTFQPSEMAKVAIIVLLARNIVKYPKKIPDFKSSFRYTTLPLAFLCLCTILSGFSTTLFIFITSCIVLFVGNYSFKSFLKLSGSALLIFALLFATIKIFPDITNRFDTWESRIDTFFSSDESGGLEKSKEEIRQEKAKKYQVEHSKMALLSPGFWGVGPGKSMQKYFLPQSNSDFIYAIIVEEYGLLIGALGPIFLYLILLIRCFIISLKTPSDFGRLLIIGLSLSIVFQAFINMGVATTLLPTTGQTLPLISAGGSSIWMTCLALGIIQAVAQQNIDQIKAKEEAYRTQAETHYEQAQRSAQKEGITLIKEDYIRNEIKKLKALEAEKEQISSK